MSSFYFFHHRVSLLKRSNLNNAFFGQCLEGIRSRSKCTTTAGLRVHRNSPRVFASWWLASPKIASVFTYATTAVLPFYTLMVVAPKKELTKKCMKSSIPYVVLGLLYAYILYLSWTPDTIRLLFGGKNWMPELAGIVKMFSNEITLVSAWIHLLTVDLFAARVVYNDGVENNIETRHSVCLCMLCCPIGIATHALTKALTKTREI